MEIILLHTQHMHAESDINFSGENALPVIIIDTVLSVPNLNYNSSLYKSSVIFK
jgi:hypothetical protein